VGVNLIFIASMVHGDGGRQLPLCKQLIDDEFVVGTCNVSGMTEESTVSQM